MPTNKGKPKTIAAYINAAPKDTQKKLREMRANIKKTAPGAEESLKWSMPAFSYRRILVMFAAFKNHISFFPTPSAVKAFTKELKKYNVSKGTIQFPLDKPLPLPLIRKITAFRVKEEKQLDRKWREKVK